MTDELDNTRFTFRRPEDLEALDKWLEGREVTQTKEVLDVSAMCSTFVLFNSAGERTGAIIIPQDFAQAHDPHTTRRVMEQIGWMINK
jgi:hypothetical protein